MLVVDPPVPCPSELDRCTGTWAHWRNVVQPRNIDSFKYCLGWQFSNIYMHVFLSWLDTRLCLGWVLTVYPPNWPAVSASTIWVNAWQATALQWIWGISRHWLLYMLFYTLGVSQNSGTPNPLAHPWRTNHLEKCLVSPLKAPYLWRSEMFNGLTWGHGPSGARWWLLPIGGNHFVVIELIAKFVNYNLLGGLNHFLFFHILGIVIPTD